ncbi:MAG: sulfite exporter TauE/SafE family protein [Verrucomicrobiaceae bacterium]
MPLSDWLTQHTLIQDSHALVLALLAALCIGMSKAGLAGAATLNVVLMAEAFGAMPSVGLVLPLLIFADLMGYAINHKGGSWRQIVPLIPPAAMGVVAGWMLLHRIDAAVARPVIGWTIILLLAFKLLLDMNREVFADLHRHRFFTWGMGTAAGTTTMLANAAGPVMTVYLLSQRFEKKEYLGVFSRFFLFINLLKLPFSADLGIITPASLKTNLVLLPGVVAGVLLGWLLLRKMSQTVFERVMFLLTLAAAARMVI